jgi:hypothetical protein
MLRKHQARAACLPFFAAVLALAENVVVGADQQARLLVALA